MKHAGFPFLLLGITVLAGGCSRQGQQATEAHTGSATTSDGNTRPKEKAGAWTYHSKEYDFSLSLPSVNWKQIAKKRFIADFWTRTRTGSPMLAGVTSVKKQTREQFQTSIPQFKADAEKGKDFLVKPTFEEGKTDSGNPYVYAALCEKGDSGSQFIFVATAAVWLADKGTTVTTVFEGQGQMRSKVFKSIEYAEFEAAAKSICLSPR
jgi:hypothetical protein